MIQLNDLPVIYVVEVIEKSINSFYFVFVTPAPSFWCEVQQDEEKAESLHDGFPLNSV